MKNNPVAIFTGLAVAAAVGLGAIIYSRQPATIAEKPPEPTVAQPATPEKPADATAEKKPEAAPAEPEQTAKTETPAPETAPAADTATAPEPAKQPETKAEAAPKPTFDTVRVESDGGTLAAGQATPGADVTLKRNGEVVGKAQANADGDWVVVTDAPLPKGTSELSVEQKTPDAGQVVMSDQSIAVVVPANPNEKAMVALVEPGMPTQVLQKTEPVATAEATPAKPADTAETAAKTDQPAAETTVAGGGETPATVEKAPEAAPETKTAAVEPTPEPSKTEEPAAQPPAAEQPAVEQPKAETPVAKPGAPISLDAVDYNSSGDIVFSGSAAPGSAVRVYVDNAAVGDALADQGGRWTFAGTQKIAPGGHSLRVDQIDSAGKVLSRVELPFVREEASRVAEVNTPEPQPAAQPEQQKTAEIAEPAPATPEATVAAETEAPKPTTSETSEAAATVDTQVTPESAAPATQAETEVAKPDQGEEVAKTETPAVTPTEDPAATAEQPAAKTEEPAVAAQAEPSTQSDTTEQAASTDQSTKIEQKSTDAAGATVASNEQAQTTEPKKGRIIIQPGNNLWKLSRVIYGKGMSYTVIYEANKGQIRDPDLIYPGQIFATPDAVPPETIDPKRKQPLSAEEGGTTVQ
jgi:nucleoid-associated protein YgaU